MNDPRPDLAPPEQTYLRRAAEREAGRGLWSRRSHLLGFARLAVFAAAILSLWLAWRAGQGWPWSALIPLAVAFALLVAVHERVVRRRDAAGRAVTFYREGLERLRGRPRPAAASAPPDGHPYAGDLDVLGPGSLFERMDATRTPFGRRALARRLTSASPEPPSAAEVRRRQQAVLELVPQLDLREALAEAGHAAHESESEAARLIGWAASPPAFARPGLMRAVALGMPAILLALVVAAVLGAPSWPAWAWTVVVLWTYAWTSARAHAVTRKIETPARVLGNYQRLAAVIEAGRFEAGALAEIAGRLRAGRPPASREIRRLRRVVVWTDALRNQIVAAIGLFLLWELHCALSLESWRRRSGLRLEGWLDAIGEIEATASLAGYAYEHPEHAFPEVLDDGDVSFHGEGLGHPLLDPARCVRNDLELGGPGSVLLVSGSNMSGKSTMLRSVGANAVLALTGTAVCATRLALTPMAVVTSMRVVDSLQQGTSHFLAELRRLKRVTDLCDAGVPLLYLLDEVLHGTNSRERRLGVRDLVAHLIAGGAMGLITTHDLDLAELEERHPGQVHNVHFADHLEDGVLRFDYRLRAGVARTTNALRLMREVGIPLHGAEG